MATKTFAVTNLRTGAKLATTARLADTFWTRLKGLTGVREFPAGAGLVIVPCNSVHCIGMRINIDVVFLSREREVLHLLSDMAPGRVSKLVRKSRAVVELPAGTIAATGTQVGDTLDLEGVL